VACYEECPAVSGASTQVPLTDINSSGSSSNTVIHVNRPIISCKVIGSSSSLSRVSGLPASGASKNVESACSSLVAKSHLCSNDSFSADPSLFARPDKCQSIAEIHETKVSHAE